MTEAGGITARSALRFVTATRLRQLLLVLVLAVPVVLAATGGLDRAQSVTLTAAPGATTDSGAYLAVPRHYFVSDRIDAGSLDEGEQWLGAVVQLTNQGPEAISVTFSDPTFELPDEARTNDRSANPYEVMRLDTGTRLGSAQPGLTYEVALLWRTTGLREPPAELTFTMHETTWTRWTIEAGTHSWRLTPRSYDMTLPLGEAPESILEEEETE